VIPIVNGILLTIGISASVGCGSYRVPINAGAPSPVYATDSKTLRGLAAQHHDVTGRVVWGLATYEPASVDVHWWLTRDQHAAVIAHEIGHHLERRYGPGVWEIIDQFAPPTLQGFVQFPIASDYHPTRRGCGADDRSEPAQRAWAEYRALTAHYANLKP
jgi:hypothetical protein